MPVTSTLFATEEEAVAAWEQFWEEFLAWDSTPKLPPDTDVRTHLRAIAPTLLWAQRLHRVSWERVLIVHDKPGPEGLYYNLPAMLDDGSNFNGHSGCYGH